MRKRLLCWLTGHRWVFSAAGFHMIETGMRKVRFMTCVDCGKERRDIFP